MFLKSQHIVLFLNAVAAQEHVVEEVVPKHLYMSRLMTKPTK